ncbi:MAG TPA: phage virion morphogenesis protein [Blastocatellia bacterium]|nr:phage virion morphogenesis protein [Blastocatellia bacterium]
MLNAAYDIQGEEKFERAIRLLYDSFRDFRRLWPQVANEFYRIEREQFNSQGAGGASGAWRELSPGYEKYKAVKHPGKPILQASGHLKESLTDPTNKDHVFRMTEDSLILGTTDPVGQYHQKGTDRLPQRKIFDLTDDDKRRLRDVARREFQRVALELKFEIIGFDGF